MFLTVAIAIKNPVTGCLNQPDCTLFSKVCLTLEASFHLFLSSYYTYVALKVLVFYSLIKEVEPSLFHKKTTRDAFQREEYLVFIIPQI